ncbi:AGAP008681-PA [Anopheles gambiae str. PEST]|uniref:AGAP008681-PA n=1 Tax=Anopheles gambiae TaxID=7165 RepID=A0NE36_ANOGA|nr:AGAP008681-PA [Anopheles gambiae str. PEST]
MCVCVFVLSFVTAIALCRATRVTVVLLYLLEVARTETVGVLRGGSLLVNLRFIRKCMSVRCARSHTSCGPNKNTVCKA